jgi:hypothetical protein
MKYRLENMSSIGPQINKIEIITYNKIKQKLNKQTSKKKKTNKQNKTYKQNR